MRKHSRVGLAKAVGVYSRLRSPLLSAAAAAVGLLVGCTDEADVRLGERWVKPRLSLEQPFSACPPRVDRSLPVFCGAGRPDLTSVRRLAATAEERPDLRYAVAALLDADLLVEPGSRTATSSGEWSDLAALELVRIAREGGRRRAWRALEACRRALEIEPGNVRALFNQALAAEQLYLDELARESWLRYLEHEVQPEWRREAREHLLRLDAPSAADRWRSLEVELPELAGIGPLDDLSREFAFEIRQAFLDTFLPRWAAEPLDPRLCGELVPWGRLARAYGAVTADDWLEATVEWLSAEMCESLESAGLQRAISDVSKAFELYDRADSAASLELLQQARPVLAAAESPLVAVVDLYAAVNVFALNRYTEARTLFEHMEPLLRDRGFLFLAARAAWLQGTIALRRQDLAGAADHYRRASGLFDRIADRSHRAAVRGLLAETLGRMGRFDEAWASGLEGLRLARELGREHRLFTSCSLLGVVAGLERAYGLAAAFQDCAARHVRTLGNQAATTDVLLWRAAWQFRAGRGAEALSSLEEARRAAAAISDAEERRQALADLALVEGALLLESSPRLALRRLVAATEFFDQIGHHYYAADARLLRSSAALALGDADQAERDLMAALRLHEEHRLEDVDPESRLAVLQSNQTIYDRLVEFQLDQRGDPWLGLFFADRGKQDRFEPTAERTSGGRREIEETLERWRRALAALPEDFILVSYQLLPEELVAWVVRARGEIFVVRAPRPREESSTVSVRSAEWAELLSRPLEGRVTEGALVVVVPDKELNDVPFASLRPRSADKPIVERAAVLVTTSIDDFLAPSQGSQPAGLHTVHAFLAPELATEWGALPALLPSPLEAAALRDAFSRVEILEAEDATAGRFLDRLAVPGVLQFSGHVLVDERRPLQSALLFSPDADRTDGRVTAGELYALAAPRSSLVILAGCGSGAAPQRLPIGLSIVRPFLHAGVPAVLGSLRPVSDADFARFISYFYDELRKTHAVVPAFRETQRRLMRESPHVDGPWAEIQLYATGRALDLRRSHV